MGSSETSHDSDRDVMTVPEMARYMRVSLTTAYRMVSDGRVPFIAIGKRRVIPRAALQQWMNEEAAAARSA